MIRAHFAAAQGRQAMPMTIPEAATLTVTFFYYRDLPRAMALYEEVMGFTLAIDQGWSKIYRAAGAGHIGLVDESRGSHRAADTKPVQFAIRVPDVDAWHAWISSHAPDALARQPRFFHSHPDRQGKRRAGQACGQEKNQHDKSGLFAQLHGINPAQPKIRR